MKKAVTLLELLIVVLIIGVLAVIAVPKFEGIIEKARITEAVRMIRAMYIAEDVYHLEHDSYVVTGDPPQGAWLPIPDGGWNPPDWTGYIPEDFTVDVEPNNYFTYACRNTRKEPIDCNW